MISVIIPCKNRFEELCRCLCSILRSIQIAHEQFTELESEIIIVNDHSDINFPVKVQNKFPQVTIVDTIGVGPGFARNYGLNICKGDYIFFTDSDCVVDENWIYEGLLEFYRGDPLVIQGNPWLFQKNINYGLATNEENLYRTMFSTYISANKTLMTDSRNLMVKKQIVNVLGKEIFSQKSNQATAESRIFGSRCIEYGVPMYWNEGIKVYHEDPVSMLAVCKQKYRHGLGRIELWKDIPEFSFLRKRYFDWPLSNNIETKYVLIAHFSFLYGYFNNLGKNKTRVEFLNFIDKIFCENNIDKELYLDLMGEL